VGLDEQEARPMTSHAHRFETYADRAEAGRRLGEHLAADASLADPVVLALPRGGVPVAAEVARALGAPLEVFVARKLGAPSQPELGIGAIAEGGDRVVDAHLVRMLGVDPARLDQLEADERHELARRVERYRGGRTLPDLSGRDVLLVDDGLATGVTAEAALGALRRLGPRRLVLAAPVGAADTVARLRAIADEVVCLLQPVTFQAVGSWYDDFTQTTDDEVTRLLAEHGSS